MAMLKNTHRLVTKSRFAVNCLIKSPECNRQTSQKHQTRQLTSINDHKHSDNVGDNRWKYGCAALAGLGSVGLALYLKSRATQTLCAEGPATTKAGVRRTDLPNYRKADILKRRSAADGGIWVTYKDGVYDITEFMEGHPGGDKILLAAGGSVEPFWQMYAVHKNPEVFEILEELRIGNVHPDDRKDEPKVTDMNDPYRNDPKRHIALKINAAKPFNAETPSALLTDNFYTPNDLFFVRNHLPVPKIETKSFKLEVGGVGIKRAKSFSLSDLKKFKQHELVATVQCAGNRRSQMRKVKEVKGLDWGTSAISNASWTGVKLSDVLASLGADEDKVSHVLFQGGDKDLEGVPYEASIPAETAFDPRKDVLLVYKMNGEDLPLDHGYPLRVVVPGTIGARNVKWVKKIILSETESNSHWQQNDYKAFNSSTDWSNADFSKAQAIQEYPIQSSITEPREGAKVVAGSDVVAKGYAWSGGGRGILRVDISIDGGKTWHEAALHKHPQKRHREWAWTLWDIEIPVPEALSGQTLEIICKATDTSHNAQPELPESIWNLRGLIYNAWHRLSVNVIED